MAVAYAFEQMQQFAYNEVENRLTAHERGGITMVIANELDSTCGISDEELTERFKESIRIDNEIRRIKGAPIAKYDKATKRAYLEYPDGRREYVGQ